MKSSELFKMIINDDTRYIEYDVQKIVDVILNGYVLSHTFHIGEFMTKNSQILVDYLRSLGYDVKVIFDMQDNETYIQVTVKP